MKKLVVPFDNKGNQLGYSYWTLSEEEIEEVYELGIKKLGDGWDECYFKPNKNFYDELEYVGYSRGRSSIKINFKSLLTNIHYEMFMTDFNDLLINKCFNNPLKGNFTFCKRGANYGIKKTEKEGIENE